MSGDNISAGIDDSGNVIVGSGNRQQVVHLDRNETAQYLSDANLKLEMQLGRLVDKLERIVDRLNEIERRLIAIESSTHHRSNAQPLNWNIIVLSIMLAFLIGLWVLVIMVRS
jgi:hypothetical protein